MAGKVVQEGTANAKPKASASHPPILTLVRLCVAAWLVPGLGHLMLGRKWRALILFASIGVMFVLG
ncbi:MAG: DUF6677 family protein, partial [Terriglobia bacterium]